MLRHMIGDEAEFLVYLFAVTDRPKALLTRTNSLRDHHTGDMLILWPRVLRDLREIEAANLIDQGGGRWLEHCVTARLAMPRAMRSTGIWRCRMGLNVVTVASGGLAVAESTAGGTPVSESASGRGLPVTKVTGGKPGLPVVYETIGIAASLTSFDAASASNVTLSNGNLTVVHTSSATAGGARSASFKNSGKYYFEMLSQFVASSSDCVGLLTSTGAVNSDASLDAQSVALFLASNTFIYCNSVSQAPNFGNRALGDVWGVAVDFGPPRFVWFRKSGGLWNMSGAANPATGVGGLSFAAASYAPWVRYPGGVSGEGFTANFGATAYANAAPAGFGNWTA